MFEFESHKSWIICKFYKNTGHIAPLGVIENEEIAKREVHELSMRWDNDEFEIRAIQTNTYESAAAACVGINEKLDNLEKLKNSRSNEN